MSDHDQRLETLEQLVSTLTKSAQVPWLDDQLLAALDAAHAETDPNKQAASYRLAGMLANARKSSLSRQVAQQQPPAQPSLVDANEVLRRNSLLFEYYDRILNTAKSYTTAITTIGYAGLLAIWAGLRENLDPFSLLGTAVLILISLAVFAVWEMAKAVVTQRWEPIFNDMVSKSFSGPDFEINVSRAHAMHNAEIDKLNKTWQPTVFRVTAFSGFAAGVWLLLASASAAVHLRITLG